LLLSQVLTLYTTPVIYIFFDGLGNRFSRNGNKHTSNPNMGGDPEPDSGHFVEDGR
jgi:multidrug efflux pump